MPFEPNQNARIAPLSGAEDLDFTEAENPDFWTQTIPAAYRLENLATSALAEDRAEDSQRNIQGQSVGVLVEEDFDPLTEENLAGYEQHAHLFGRVLTRDQNRALKANIDRETADREVLEASGAWGFVAQLAAGATDPTVFIPVGGQIRRGESLLRITGRAAAAAGISTVPQEMGLLDSQAIRTEEESALNVAGATFLGGVLGSAIGGLVNLGSAARSVDEGMRMPGPDEPDWGSPAEAVRMSRSDLQNSTVMTQPASAGAAASPRLTLEQQQIDGVANRAIARTASSLPYLSSEPLSRTLLSESIAARETIESLADIASPLTKNNARMETRTLPDGSTEEYLVWGQPTRQSVESNIRLYDAMLGENSVMLDRLHQQYLRSGTNVSGIGARVRSLSGAVPEGKMTRPDFGVEVIRSMRRGDVHEVPEIQEAAKTLRREFMDPLKDQAVELGMFGYDMVPDPNNPDGPPIIQMREPNIGDTAESYVARVYNRERIERQRPEFFNRILRHFQRRRQEAQESLGRLSEDIDGAREVMRAELGEVRDIIRERNQMLRDARQGVARADANTRASRRQVREAQTQSNAAERRAATVDRETLSPVERSYWRGLQRDIKRGHGEDRPIPLAEWVQAQGGIRDPQESGFDLSHLRRPGLLNFRTPSGPGSRVDMKGERVGLPADLLREAAVESGYLSDDATLVDFIDALTDDVSGRRVYSQLDNEILGYQEYLEALADQAAEDTFDLPNASPEDFANWMTGQSFQKISRFQSGRISEARLREEQAGRRLREAQDRLEDFEIELDDARVALRTAHDMAPELTARAREQRKRYNQARREYQRVRDEFGRAESRANREDFELESDANETVDNILAGPDGRIGGDAAGGGSRSLRIGPSSSDIIGLSGRFKQRALDIPDIDIEDFLESDIHYVMRATLRSMAPDIELIKRFGSIDMEGQLRRVVDDFNELIAAADPADEGAIQRLHRRRRAAIDDLTGVRDRLRGTYGAPENPNAFNQRAIRVAKSLNILRLMGGVTISSIPDVARAVMAHGIGRSLGAPFRALTGNLNAIKGMDAELRAAGPGFEMILNSRILAMADVLDDYGRHTRMERMMQGAQGHFGMASLIAPWNRTMKAVAGYGVQNRIMALSLRAADGKASVADASLLARLGISGEDATAIARLFREHGSMDGGNHIANSAAWGDARLRRVWLNSVAAEVSRLVVTPGQDKPLIASTSWGSLLMQFRSYNFAATQRVLMAYTHGALSARDAHVTMALVTQLGLGVIVARIKAAQSQIDTSDWSERKWIVEGFDRSGLLGAFSDMNMMLEYGTGGALGLSALAGDERLTRFEGRNMAGQFLGPTMGAAQDVAYGASGLLGASIDSVRSDEDPDLKRGHIRALRRLLPFQNIFYLRSLFDRLEDATGDVLGADGESRAERGARLN